MDILSIGDQTRETYKIHMDYSLLYEAALGMAAITNASLRSTLVLEESYWLKAATQFSYTMKKEIEYVKTHNTWKTMLQLLQHQRMDTADEWEEYLNQLSEVEFKEVAIPYLGQEFEEVICKAVRGSNDALKKVYRHTKNHPFYSNYIEHIVSTPYAHLVQHLITVMKEWWETFISPQQEELQEMLERDIEKKMDKLNQLHPEKFVEWATNGMPYLPEPYKPDVLLIPHYCYRPWNIEAEKKGTKVIYYPLAEDSIKPEQGGVPSELLVRGYKSLADETRMMILHLLAKESKTLKELTNLLEMGKTTVHHHVKLLKASRFVTQTGHKYRLNPDKLDQLAAELKEYILHVEE